MSAPTEQEILREARRVFRKLADVKAKLVPLADGNWSVIQRGEPQSGRIKLRAEMVSALQRRGWLEAHDAVLVLSDAGRSWTIAEVAGMDLFTAQHQRLGFRVIHDDDGDERVAIVNEAESPLSWLKSRGGIDAVQFEAGERLRHDYALAHLEPRLCVDLSAPVVLGSGPVKAGFISDTALAAKQRFAKALSVVGPGLSDLLFDVCCALKGLEAAESGRKWPRRSGKVVLGLALDRLAAHYGIAAPSRSRLRSWSAASLEAAHG